MGGEMQQTNLLTINKKVELWVSVAWGLVAMFCLVGFLFSHDHSMKPVIVTWVAVMGWTITRMVYEGIVGVLSLVQFHSKKP
jgi:hypothetical protein